MYKRILRFDNSDVGCIDEYVSEHFYNNDNKLDSIKIKIQEDIRVNLIKYKNAFPLIVSDIKDLFRVPRIKYNVVTINDVKYLAYESSKNVPLIEYTKTVNIKNIDLLLYKLRYVFAFNYLIGINLNYEKNVLVFPISSDPSLVDMKNTKLVTFKTINEKSYKFEDNEMFKSVIKKWFENSDIIFDDMFKSVVEDIDPEAFKWRAEEIVKKYDSNYMSWINTVYERLLNAKGM